MQALKLAFALVFLTIASAADADWITVPDSDVRSGLSPTLAAELLAVPGPVLLQREDITVPSWTVISDGKAIGYVGSTWELSGSTGYSGRPVDVLVAITPEARMAGAKLMRHNEPILTLGITDEDIAAFVGAFAGVDLGNRDPAAFRASPDLPDVISRATVSTGVIRDAILRTGRTLALGHGLIPGNGGIDR